MVSKRRAALAGIVVVPVAGALMAAAPAPAAIEAAVVGETMVEAPVLAQTDTVIRIRTTGSNLSFEPANVNLKAGSTVRVVYENAGTLPHNILLLRDRSNIDAIGIAALDAAGNDYVPEGYDEEILGASPLAAPGETVEFTITVPDAGDYPFICTYPGHFRAMQGVLRSQNR